jgi:hypothetical protein
MDGRIVGFMTLVKDARRFYFYDVVLRHLRGLSKLAFLSCLRKPSTLLSFVDRAFTVVRFSKGRASGGVSPAIISFGVLRDMREPMEIDGRQGRISLELFKLAAQQFQEWGAGQFKVYTPKKNRVAVIFYLQRGGKISEPIDSFEGAQVVISFDMAEVLRRHDLLPKDHSDSVKTERLL